MPNVKQTGQPLFNLGIFLSILKAEKASGEKQDNFYQAVLICYEGVETLIKRYALLHCPGRETFRWMGCH